MFKQFTIHSIDKCSQLYHEAKLFNGKIYRLRFWQDLARFKIIKCLNAQHIINILHMCHLGFPVDETFREKMRKFSFSFCKLFRENFVKTMNVIVTASIHMVFSKINAKQFFANIFFPRKSLHFRKKSKISRKCLRNTNENFRIFSRNVSFAGNPSLGSTLNANLPL